ncbi:fatty acid elongase [Angomonas deanei]|nr:fatty acid elongase [Angomonas deanei]|eukprot:EPY29805.1 fatty acid elongase [Angomonas deanei]
MTQELSYNPQYDPNRYPLFDFMRTFEGESVRLWMCDHIEVPVLVAGAYFFLIIYVPDRFMKNREPLQLKNFNRVWNLTLALYSLVGAFYTVPMMYMNLFSKNYQAVLPDGSGRTEIRHGGLFNTLCDWNPTEYYDGPVGFFVSAFILSKIPEMIDTILIILQKKQLIFLHWYHHITVMLYCWHAYTRRISGGIVYAAMNYFVHSIMYSYYLMCTLGLRKYVRPFAPLITFLQIAQMVAGTFFEVACLYYLYRPENKGHAYDRSVGCDTDPTNARLGMMMYMTYYYMFCKLFKRSYIDKKSVSREGQALEAKKQK